MDWEMPENIDKMTRTVQESFSSQTQSNSEMTAAAKNMGTLPAAVADAVARALNGIGIKAIDPQHDGLRITERMEETPAMVVGAAAGLIRTSW